MKWVVWKHEGLPKITSRVRRTMEQAVVRCRNTALRAGLMMRQAVKAISGWLKRDIVTGSHLYYRHSLPLRIMHWSNVLFIALLLMSGLNIFNAHPALYWGRQSYSGSPPVLELRGVEDAEGGIVGVTRIYGHEFKTTGFLGASNDPRGELTERGFPSWLTVPGFQWLAMARRWHFFIAWLFVINGIAFVAHGIGSRHLQRGLIPTKQDFRSIGRTIVDHLLFRHPRGEASKHYNVLQKCAYLSVIFCLLPLMILMGLGMSPAMDALFPGWVDLFSGRQSVRTVHFVIAWLLVLFAMVHVFMVIVTGFWNNVRSMITGNYRITTEPGHES